MNYYEIDPVDTLFFRGGRPYNMGETQNDVKSMFPPTPYTMVGALRAALARKMGWKQGPWEQSIIEKLGDGNDIGNLEFYGPFIQADGELLFPFPRHVLAQKEDEKWTNFRKLMPAEKEIESDDGPVRYPALGEYLEKMKNVTGFINSSDLHRILWGEDITKIEPIALENIWKHEFNVGIQRDEEKLKVEEGHLFSRRFVRLREKKENGTDKNKNKIPDGMNVNMVSGIEGTDIALDEPLMIGGEAKAAFIEIIDDLILPDPPDEKLKKFIAVLITPASLGKLEVGENVNGLPDHVELVSVCADRPQMIGGWDFNKGPLPLKPYMKAGSVLFCNSEEGIDPNKWNGKKIGNNTEFGFGQILIGKW